MRAAVVHRYGPAENVEIATLPPPSPRPGSVVVRVRASSVNPLDVKLRAGTLRPFLRLRFPAVLGFDFAGEIDAVGQGVTGWAAGDRVYGRTDAATGGTHAELAEVKAAVIDRMPSRLSFVEAGSLPLVAMTAVQALRQVDLLPGEQVLVNGAAGGVGTAAVQIARALGADVTGVCSRGATALVERLGAVPIDYTSGALAGTGKRFDVVLDTVSSRPTADISRVLQPAGRYVTTGFQLRHAVVSAIAGLWSSRRATFVMSRADGTLMRAVSGFVERGQLDAVLEATYPLERIADAHRHVECGHAHGKVVVTIP